MTDHRYTHTHDHLHDLIRRAGAIITGYAYLLDRPQGDPLDPAYLTDLLTDLRHWALAVEHEGFDEAVRSSQMHFDGELSDDEFVMRS